MRLIYITPLTESLLDKYAPHERVRSARVYRDDEGNAKVYEYLAEDSIGLYGAVDAAIEGVTASDDAHSMEFTELSVTKSIIEVIQAHERSLSPPL